MNLNTNDNHKDMMVSIFCIIDDLVKILKNKNLWNNKWRKSSLKASEVITITIFWKLLWYTRVKWIYWHIRNYFCRMFKMPSYKTFIELSNKYALEWVEILSMLMNLNQKNVKQNLYFIDSSKIAVCWNKRIFNHKVCKWFAQRWKSTMGRFYWFKLHIITDSFWNLLRIKVTPWNIDDRNPVLSMVKNLTWMLVWDAWYISEELRNELWEKWIHFLTWVKKNMKKLMTEGQHKVLKARQIVETTFSVLKWTKDLVSYFDRSIDWHFARIVYALLTFSISRQLNSHNFSIS
jgi:transposase